MRGFKGKQSLPYKKPYFVYNVTLAEDRAEIRMLENTLKVLINEEVRNTVVSLTEQQILHAGIGETSFYVQVMGCDKVPGFTIPTHEMH